MIYNFCYFLYTGVKNIVKTISQKIKNYTEKTLTYKGLLILQRSF